MINQSLKKQKTIKKQVSIKGIGLHTGVQTIATFKPAKENFGIRFKRLDLKDCPEIVADIDHVVDISRGTTIGQNDFRIHTVEHILSAVWGLQIDNILIELTEKEPPVMDGSAKPFVDILLKSGLQSQQATRDELIIDQTITYNDAKREVDIHILPSDKFRVTFMTDYNVQSLGTQYTAMYSLEDDFIEEFSSSRTFCLFSEIMELNKQGLIKGGSLENAVVVKDDKVINEEGLRNSKEFVNHKILDCMGDLYLSGYKIIGKVISSQGGHKLTNQLLRKLFDEKSNFSIIEIKEKNIPHSLIHRNFLKSIA